MEEWSRLSHPDNVQSYWESTEDQKDFDKTLALVFCWSVFDDAIDDSCRMNTVLSVAVIWKPSSFPVLPFVDAALEFDDSTVMTPILLVV